MSYNIPKEIIRDIQERLSIVEVVGDYVRLQKDGANYKGLCPFHQEKTASFKVNESKKMFKCFGCGKGGDVIGFLMLIESMSFPEAVQKLAARAGINIPRQELSPEEKQKEENRGLLFRANEAAARFYHETLLNSERAAPAREYLESRGFSGETVNKFMLGYAPAGWSNVIDHLTSKGVPVESIHGAGLAIPRESGGYYDRFRERLMFPIMDVQGRIRGFGARIITDDKDQPKYINSPETPIYKKGDGYFGLYQAKEQIRKQNLVVIVEGYFDQIALHQAGIEYAVATLGTALTIEQARLIRRYTSEVFLVFDADEAGRKAAFRSLESFIEADLSPRVVLIPQGKDPDDYIKNHSAGDFENLMKSSPLLFNFYMDDEVTRAGSSPANISGAVRRIGEMIGKVSDGIQRSAYTDRLARRTGLHASQLKARRKRPERKKDDQVHGADLAAFDDSDYPPPELTLLRLVVHHPETAAKIRESGAVGCFRHQGLAGLISAILEQNEELGKMDSGEIISRISDPGLSDLLSRVIFESDPFSDKAAHVVDEVIDRVRKGDLEAQLTRLRQEIEDAQERGDEGRWRELLQRQQTLLARQRNISSGGAGEI